MGFPTGMDQPLLPTSLVLIPGILAVGLYLLLSQPEGPDQRRVVRLGRRTGPQTASDAQYGAEFPSSRWGLPVWWLGAALVGLLLILLVLLVRTDVDGWPESRLDSPISAGAYVLLAAGSLGCSAWCITSRDRGRSRWAFLLMLVATSGVLLFLEAFSVAAAMLLLASGAAAASLKWPGWSHEAPADTGPQQPFCREPLLSCTAGALLAVTLAGTVHYAWAVEALRDSTSSRHSALPRISRQRSEAGGQQIEEDDPPSAISRPSPPRVPSDYRLLHHSLIVGAWLFGLGAVGWVCRRDRATMVLSGGIMLQGAVVTLSAFDVFHESGTGQIVSLIVLAVGAIAAGLGMRLPERGMQHAEAYAPDSRSRS